MKYVVDTSAIISKAVTSLIKEGKIKGTIIIPNAVIAELENQGNRGLEIGFIGLEEIKEIRNFKEVTIEFLGERPNELQIRYAKSGEIDALIRELAYKEKAVLITADLVQSESGKAFGLEVIYLEKKELKEKLEFEKYFDERTMSIHIKEEYYVVAKKGFPGNWALVKVSKEKLNAKEIEEIAKEVIEKSRVDPKTFVEISRRGSTIVQSHNYRIVIVRPPISDGWEITVVRPLKKLALADYNLDSNLFERLKQKSRGIIIAGEPGGGKSTFVQALGEFYFNLGKVVKTVESPRDLQLPKGVTQYSKNFASKEEIHDILFLSRPDNIIFDEMRDTPDFELFGDLRLAGSECIGVIHSSEPIDAVQRFITRIDLGVIPSIIDTIIFMSKGEIGKILSLKMIVKVPSGMTESDLARPVIEVRDFLSNKLEFEIYSYGEQKVVIPIDMEIKENSVEKLAKIAIEREFKNYVKEVEVAFINKNRVSVSVPEKYIARVIGKDGNVINNIEEKLGIGIDIKELKKEKNKLNFDFNEDKKNFRIFVEPGREIEIYLDGKLVMTGYSSKRGEVKISKSSQIGRELIKAIHSNRNLEVRG